MEDRFYFIKVKWYNEYANLEHGEQEEVTNCFYAFAPSISSLATRIDNTFSDILEVKIKEISSICENENFFYVDTLTKEERQKIEDCNGY